ncbi:MAG: hypothetical protein AAB368_10680, partial [bacterium]
RVGCLFAGLGLTFKYPAAYAILPMLAWVCWATARRSGMGAALHRAAVAGIVIAACLLPWAVSNFAATGDPLFPLLSRWLARTPDLKLAAEEWQMHSRIQGPGLRAGLMPNLLLPFTLVFRDPRMGGMEFGWLGLGLWPLLAWAARRHKAAAFGLATGVGAFALWYLTARRARYLLPAFAVGFLGLAPALEDLARRGRWLPVGFLCGVTVLSHAWWVIRSGDLRLPPLAVVTGRMPERDWAAQRDPVFAAARLVEEQVPPAGRVMVLCDERLKYLTERDVVVHSLFQRSVFWSDLAVSRSASDLESRLAGRGITHILYDESRVDRLIQVNRVLQMTPREREIFNGFRRRLKETGRVGTWVLGRVGT